MANRSPVSVGSSNGYLVLSVTKAAVSGVTWSAESCDNLVSWSATSTTVLTDDSGTFEARDDFALGTTPRRFLRLKVMRN